MCCMHVFIFMHLLFLWCWQILSNIALELFFWFFCQSIYSTGIHLAILKLWEYGMHKFPAIKCFFVYLWNSKQMHLQTFTHSKADYRRQRVRSVVEKIFVIFPYKHVQCVKSVLGTWIQWLGFGEITISSTRWASDFRAFQLWIYNLRHSQCIFKLTYRSQQLFSKIFWRGLHGLVWNYNILKSWIILALDQISNMVI